MSTLPSVVITPEFSWVLHYELVNPDMLETVVEFADAAASMVPLQTESDLDARTLRFIGNDRAALLDFSRLLLPALAMIGVSPGAAK